MMARAGMRLHCISLGSHNACAACAPRAQRGEWARADARYPCKARDFPVGSLIEVEVTPEDSAESVGRGCFRVRGAVPCEHPAAGFYVEPVGASNEVVRQLMLTRLPKGLKTPPTRSDLLFARM